MASIDKKLFPVHRDPWTSLGRWRERMKSIAAQAVRHLRPLARNVVPSPIRRWLREQQRLLPQTRQTFYDQIFERELAFANTEGFSNFDFVLRATGKKPGVSAVLRIKNEEDKIYYSLGSILAIFDEIVVVDNGSQDRTPEIVRTFKQRYDSTNKIRFYSYPFKLARCGPENTDFPGGFCPQSLLLLQLESLEMLQKLCVQVGWRYGPQKRSE